ncbi:MAG: penicillin acylase family protein, partial [Streptomycetales bacterium]
MLRRLRTIAVIGAIMLTVVLIGGTVYVVWAVRRPFPVVEGALPVSGLTSTVRVVRDQWGVPHIYADDALDLFRAQGYVHAQDRFWEMDVRRHVASGRLAELFGAEQVQTDAFIRTLGWRRVAERELALLSPSTRRYLEAYAEGVNAYLGTRQGPELSLEYAVLDAANPEYHPDPWTPVDSLVWLKVMAWDLRTNVKEELARALAAAELPQERVEELYPPYPFERHQPIVRRGGVVEGHFLAGAEPAPVPDGASSRLTQLSELIEDIPPLLGDAGSGVGSNSLVVSGERTRSGRPILANDPHLAPSIPATWYQMGLHCTDVDEDCPFDVAGVTFSGVPGVIIGHNARIAWGFTNLRADVADLYLEDVDRDTYRYRGRSVPLELRRETIEVAGEEPVRITVRATRHGPLLSD